MRQKTFVALPLVFFSAFLPALFLIPAVRAEVPADSVLSYTAPVISSLKPDQNPFPDTDITLEGIAAAELYRRGVISGYPDGTFGGDNNVNRAEAAKFLMLARYGGASADSSQRFPDAPSGQWYIPYINKAAELGIISGYPDGTFKPVNTINTAEFLKMMALTFSLPQNIPQAYPDVPAGSWYEKYAGAADRYNLFPHRPFGLLQPGKSVTRYEMAIAIYTVLKTDNGTGAEMGDADPDNGGSAGSDTSSLSCAYNGKTYQSGKTFRSSDDCSNCRCDSGRVLCEAKDCSWAYGSETVTLKTGESITNDEGDGKIKFLEIMKDLGFPFFETLQKVNGEWPKIGNFILNSGLNLLYLGGGFNIKYIQQNTSDVTFEKYNSCIPFYNQCIQGKLDYKFGPDTSDRELQCAKICVDEPSPVEYLYDTGGKIKGIFDKTHKDFGAYLTDGYEFCYDILKKYLGFDIPVEQIFIKSMIADNGGGGLSGLYTIYVYSTDNMLQGETENIQNAYKSMDNGFCPKTRPFAHELMHNFITGTIVSASNMDIKWLDEGLANFISINLLPRSPYEENSKIICKDKQFSIGSFTDNFVRLSYDTPSSNAVDFYDTGACFWQYIYDTFGESKFKSLLKYIGSTRYKTGTYKIFDEFRTILGKDISDIAYSRFGLRKDLTVNIK